MYGVHEVKHCPGDANCLRFNEAHQLLLAQANCGLLWARMVQLILRHDNEKQWDWDCPKPNIARRLACCWLRWSSKGPTGFCFKHAGVMYLQLAFHAAEHGDHVPLWPAVPHQPQAG